MPRAVIGEGLFDHLVGSEEQLRWDFGSECLGRLEVEDKIEFGRLHDWQVSGFGSSSSNRILSM
jgi:hypothetical protein